MCVLVRTKGIDANLRLTKLILKLVTKLNPELNPVRTKGIDAYCRAHAVELAAEVGVFDYFCLVLARKLLQAVLQDVSFSDSMQRPCTDGELCARTLTCAHPGARKTSPSSPGSSKKRRGGGQGAERRSLGGNLEEFALFDHLLPVLRRHPLPHIVRPLLPGRVRSTKARMIVSRPHSGCCRGWRTWAACLPAMFPCTPSPCPRPPIPARRGMGGKELSKFVTQKSTLKFPGGSTFCSQSPKSLLPMHHRRERAADGAQANAAASVNSNWGHADCARHAAASGHVGAAAAYVSAAAATAAAAAHDNGAAGSAPRHMTPCACHCVACRAAGHGNKCVVLRMGLLRLFHGEADPVNRTAVRSPSPSDSPRAHRVR